jgi:hypothetical protein
MLGPIPDIASRLRNVSQIIFNLEAARKIITKPLNNTRNQPTLKATGLKCCTVVRRNEIQLDKQQTCIKKAIQVSTCSEESFYT